MKPVQIYLGKPQKEKLVVCDVQQGQQITVKQLMFNNSLDTEQNVVLTLNTIDIMTTKVKSGDDVRDTFIVLNPGDKLLIQQETENAVNVMINGVSEQLMY
ncbi:MULTISPECIES: hypothetical protein [Bacillus cereus group]|uniref:hypothetical protein n=1 Tax=Bacillus cereus group TaxID=86661 RepID=UPI0022E3FA81|nr:MULTISPECIES: hypothetical protein [unclassified Bacillus cereus group]MDA2662649.1 hypothetical protein [Bacillus cereus group sp. Bc032]MDA2673372.1 hypothetical protein [Bacillus cereus group sp. Bc031]MDA2678866.1 hypothetical protein [Bacillus cereus group sp. Bc029]MDA2684375.1 hypothetical protein [Bacillus cereus group sp. Bc030]MDA2739851.1 hypothetical protein [Bacillus cereus group sp. Bc011]